MPEVKQIDCNGHFPELKFPGLNGLEQLEDWFGLGLQTVLNLYYCMCVWLTHMNRIPLHA